VVLLLSFVFGIQVLLRLQAHFGAFFHAGLVACGPVDDAHRVIGLGIVGVHIRRHAIVLLGVVELLHVQVQVGDALRAIHLLLARRLVVQYLLILIDGLLRVAIVVG